MMQMNVEARRLELRDTKFNNPHGLMDEKNTSTAYDMARLTFFCWDHPVFRLVVGTKSHRGVQLDCQGESNSLLWENTNKLLSKEPGWVGGKTGITFKAGPCLMSVNRLFIVTLLSSRTMDHRWAEAQLLSTYA